MLRVLADSNIVWSGLFFTGNEYRLLEMVLAGKVELLLPEHVLTEIFAVIERTKKVAKDKSNSQLLFQRLLQKTTVIPKEKYQSELERASKIIRDPKDAPILAAVLAVPHDFFVSGDKDFQAIEIPTYISVRELLHKIRETNYS